MKEDVVAGADATVTLRSGGRETTVDLYSARGLELLAALRLKQAAEFKLMYEPTWLGTRIIQLPEDIVAMQELLWRVRPQVVVECGIAHGGSLILAASILDLIGTGRVVGVDVEIRPHNRQAIEAHPLAHRITLIEGSSTSAAVADEVRRQCAGAAPVMVILDSNHGAAHVAAEIAAYKELVTPESYLVVMDGAQGLVADIPRGDPAWRTDNPLVAIRRFLAADGRFEADRTPERFGMTSVPGGFLRRVAAKTD
jgi:cephalosporin hydroxylase